MLTDGYYVLGGHQRDDKKRPSWHLYDHAVILCVHPENGRVERKVKYVTPPDAKPDDENAAVCFKAGTVVGDRLFVPTSTEVVVYSLPDFEQVGYLSHPWFNDVHHVAVRPDGALVVVSTGLDMVVVMTEQGDVINAYSVNEDPLWSRFSPDTDYRKVLSTKPHKSHPNYAFFVGDDLWATRAWQRDALCLTDRSQPNLGILVNYVHDGVVHGGRVYFTTVDGNIVVFDCSTREMVRRVDLNAISGKDGPLGWCRGLTVLDGERVVVGFTKVRKTKFREKVAWLKRFANPEVEIYPNPARIAAYDLANGKMLWEVDVEAHDMHAIFGIHPVGVAG